MTDPLVRFRALQPSDFTPISVLEVEAFGVDAWAEEDFRSTAKRKTSVFRIATKEGRIIGYSMCFRWKRRYHVGGVAVATDQRGQGIGARMMRNSLRTARRLGYAVVSLEVKDSNEPAIRMYKKLGFKQTGARKKYYHDGGDALIMKRYL
jgi:[ribosomal protein S18]-alanine N-acetyltransferase